MVGVRRHGSGGFGFGLCVCGAADRMDGIARSHCWGVAWGKMWSAYGALGAACWVSMERGGVCSLEGAPGGALFELEVSAFGALDRRERSARLGTRRTRAERPTNV